MRLQGRVAAITGGALGIGRATALLFAAEGATVAIGDVEVEAVEAVAKDIGERGGKAIAVGVDVGDAAQVDAFIARAVSEFGRLDVLSPMRASLIPRRSSSTPRPSGIACCS